MRTLICAFLILITFAPANAEEDFRQMMGDEIKSTFSDQTLDGFYARQNVLAGTQAYSETYHDNGSLTYLQGEFDDSGSWEIRRNQLCHYYDSDEPDVEHCFHIYQRQNCYYFFSSELKRYGIPANDYNWNNRSIIRGEGLTCEQLVS